MSKYKDCGAVVLKDGLTKGKPCVIEKWDVKAKKYKVDFYGGWCGWYSLKELKLDNG